MILDANEVKIAHENVEEALKKIENTMENEISMIAMCALAHSPWLPFRKLSSV